MGAKLCKCCMDPNTYYGKVNSSKLLKKDPVEKAAYKGMVGSTNGNLQPLDLAAMIVGGCQEMIKNRKQLDKINVFPYANKNTGEHFEQCATAIMGKLQPLLASKKNGLKKHSDVFLASAMAARCAQEGEMGQNAKESGKAGYLMTAWFDGMAEACLEIEAAAEGILKMTPAVFLELLVNGGGRIESIISTDNDKYMENFESIDGTILSVARDFAGTLEDAELACKSHKDLLKALYNAARVLLNETPNQVEDQYGNMILKQSGVVDAGASGFVSFVKGMADTIGAKKNSFKIPVNWGKLTVFVNSCHDKDIYSYKSAYSCGVLLETMQGMNFSDKKTLNQLKAKEADLKKKVEALLKKKGKEPTVMKVMCGPGFLQAHFHADKPAPIFAELAKIGLIVKRKVINLKANKIKSKWDNRHVAIICDNSAGELDKSYKHANNVRQVFTSMTVTTGNPLNILKKVLKKNKKNQQLTGVQSIEVRADSELTPADALALNRAGREMSVTGVSRKDLFRMFSKVVKKQRLKHIIYYGGAKAFCPQTATNFKKAKEDIRKRFGQDMANKIYFLDSGVTGPAYLVGLKHLIELTQKNPTMKPPAIAKANEKVMKNTNAYVGLGTNHFVTGKEVPSAFWRMFGSKALFQFEKTGMNSKTSARSPMGASLLNASKECPKNKFQTLRFHEVVVGDSKKSDNKALKVALKKQFPKAKIIGQVPLSAMFCTKGSIATANAATGLVYDWGYPKIKDTRKMRLNQEQKDELESILADELAVSEEFQGEQFISVDFGTNEF